MQKNVRKSYQSLRSDLRRNGPSRVKCRWVTTWIGISCSALRAFALDFPHLNKLFIDRNWHWEGRRERCVEQTKTREREWERQKGDERNIFFLWGFVHLVVTCYQHGLDLNMNCLSQLIQHVPLPTRPVRRGGTYHPHSFGGWFSILIFVILQEELVNLADISLIW